MIRVEDFGLFTVSKANALAPGGVEPLTADTIAAARYHAWKVDVAVRPAWAGAVTHDENQQPLPYVYADMDNALGGHRLSGVLEIVGEEPAADGATMLAAGKLAITGIVPPVEVSGRLMALPSTGGESVFSVTPLEVAVSGGDPVILEAMPDGPLVRD